MLADLVPELVERAALLAGARVQLDDDGSPDVPHPRLRGVVEFEHHAIFSAKLEKALQFLGKPSLRQQEREEHAHSGGRSCW